RITTHHQPRVRVVPLLPRSYIPSRDLANTLARLTHCFPLGCVSSQLTTRFHLPPPKCKSARLYAARTESHTSWSEKCSANTSTTAGQSPRCSNHGPPAKVLKPDRACRNSVHLSSDSPNPPWLGVV